jgi:hypothetical protein
MPDFYNHRLRPVVRSKVFASSNIKNTDPEGNAMVNVADNGLYGEEIGDECSFIVFPAPGVVYFNPSVFRMGGMKYAAQPEYSNIGHACRTSMGD